MIAPARALGRASAVGLVALSSACFSGSFASGRPCTQDADCGPELACIEGYCDGVLPTPATTEPASMGATTLGESTSSGASTSPAPETTGDETTGSPNLCDKVDILIVLDQSPSMGQWDGRLVLLANDIINFGSQVFDQVGSWHLGITMADALAVNPADCQVHGALAVQWEEGPLCASLVDRPYFDEQSEFDLLSFGCFVPHSVGGSIEQPMRSLLESTSPELNAAGACNNGFFREDALLVVIIITDEDDDPAALDGQGYDGSPGDPQYWYEKLLYRKRGNADALVVGALLGEDPGSSVCPWMLPESKSESTDGGVLSIGAEEGVRIRQFMDLLPVGHAYVSSICDDSYTDFFDQFFSEIVYDACEDYDPLAIDPMVEDPPDP